jgi:nucleoside-diphosphate-sugar epimerase
MKILVTGAAGFIGTHLCEKLHKLGHEVTGLDNFNSYYSPLLKQQNAQDLENLGIDIFKLDLSVDSLEKASECDAIIHLAGQPGISDKVSLADYVRNNITATERLTQSALTQTSKPFLLNIATSSIYGAHATDTEDTAPKPTSYYGVTKLAAEQLVLARVREQKLSACSARLFSVFGPRERPDKFFPKLISSVLEGTELPVFEGSEDHRRSFTYVGDIVNGLIAILDHQEACNGQIINIGSDLESTTGDAIKFAEKISGKKANIKRIDFKRPGDQLRTHADITKAKKLLQFSPQYNLEKGLEEMIAWYQSRKELLTLS